MGKFAYQQRSKSDMQSRQTQGSGNFASPWKQGIPVYKMKDNNRLRILPPTWPDARHYGYEAWVYYNIGQGSYLSLKRMNHEPDPVADLEMEFNNSGDKVNAKKCRATRRVVCWVIDRDNEDLGPLLWNCPWTLDRDIAIIADDQETKAMLLLDHPDEGWDITFKRDTSGEFANYIACRLATRNPTALHSNQKQADEWLDFVTNNPVPDQFHYPTFKELEDLVRGVTGEENQDESETQDADDAPTKPVRPTRPSRPTLASPDDPSPTADDPLDGAATSGDPNDQQDNAEEATDSAPVTKAPDKPKRGSLRDRVRGGLQAAG